GGGGPMTSFPEGFVWGTATAAHQVDGANWNNDWWEWEHDPSSPCVESSGDACDHWHRYPDDLRLLADLGFGSYRFSLEWSRIEPEEGEFSRAALDHYRAMCEGCRELGLSPVVTFHHFTSPRWVAAAGGWADPVTAERFARFCSRAAGHLADVMGAACTINEPNVVAFYGYRGGVFPPGERSSERRHQANHVFIEGHRRHHPHGLRVLAPGARGVSAPGLGRYGRPAVVRHRERHRHRRRRRAHRVRGECFARGARLPGRRPRRARLHVLERIRQLRVGL